MIKCSYMRIFTLHFDGSCWKNPGGTAAYGTVLELEGADEALCEEAGVIGTGPLMSNNVAEFHALAVGFQRYLESGPMKGDVIDVRGDSNLVIQIMQGHWRANADKLYYPTYKGAFALLSKIEMQVGATVEFTWIPREKNTRCDVLSKEHNKAPK